MTAKTLSVTFEGPGTDSGVPLEDLQKTFQHVQDAVRITVEICRAATFRAEAARRTRCARRAACACGGPPRGR